MTVVFVHLHVTQTLKNKIWRRRILLYILLAGVLLFLVYLLSNLGNVSSDQRHQLEHKNFVKIIEETKQNREKLLQKPFATTSVVHSTVVYRVKF